MSVDSGRFGSEHYTYSAPDYPLFSRATLVSVGVATALTAGTLALMWLARGTVLAEATIWLYVGAPLAPFPGLIVFGVALSAGRYFGLQWAVDERYALALVASTMVAVAYAAFGAGVLSLFAPSIHAASIAIAAGVTTTVTVGAAVVVHTTDYSFAEWDTYSGVLMLAGFVAHAPYQVFPPALYLAFGLILLGWIVDLVFEIYVVSDAGRSPVANGIGVYVAFMGVFVHVLQLVLRMMGNE